MRLDIVFFLIMLAMFSCVIFAIGIIIRGVVKKEWKIRRLIKLSVLTLTCVLISSFLIGECNNYKMNIKEDGREAVQKVKLESFNESNIYIFESYDDKIYYCYNGGYSSSAIATDQTKIIETAAGDEPLLIEYNIMHKNSDKNWLYKILGFSTFDYKTKGYEIYIQKSGIIKGAVKE